MNAETVLAEALAAFSEAVAFAEVVAVPDLIASMARACEDEAVYWHEGSAHGTARSACVRQGILIVMAVSEAVALSVGKTTVAKTARPLCYVTV